MTDTLFSQLGAMFRYEFLIYWRRRTVVAVLIPFLALSLLFAWTLRDVLIVHQQAWLAAGMPFDEIQRQLSTIILPAIWPVLHVFLLIIIPIVVADAIPRDRQIGVRDLLDTTPLSTGTYVFGKVLSTFLTLLIGVSVTLILVAAGWWLLVGPFDLGMYLGMWALGVVPLTLFNSALAILLAAEQPNRKQAALVGIALAVVTIMMWVGGINPRTSTLDYFNLGHPLYFKYYLLAKGAASLGATLVTPTDIVLTIGAGLLEVLAVGTFVWWLRGRGSK